MVGKHIHRYFCVIGLLLAMSVLVVAQTKVSGQAPNDGSPCAKHVSKGGQLVNAGNIDDANNEFAQAIAADPRCADAYYYKAVTLMSKATVDPNTAKLKFPAEVMTDLNNYLALAPNGPNAEAAKALFTTLGEEPKPSSSGFWNSLNSVVQNMQQQQADPDALLNASQQIEAQKNAGLATLQANQQRQREEQERQREAERQRASTGAVPSKGSDREATTAAGNNSNKFTCRSMNACMSVDAQYKKYPNSNGFMHVKVTNICSEKIRVWVKLTGPGRSCFGSGQLNDLAPGESEDLGGETNVNQYWAWADNYTAERLNSGAPGCHQPPPPPGVTPCPGTEDRF